MAYYEAVAEAARIAESRMWLFRAALRDKAARRIAEERRAAAEGVTLVKGLDAPSIPTPSSG